MINNLVKLPKGYIISGNLTDIDEFGKNLDTCLNSTNYYIQLRLKQTSTNSFESILNSVLSGVDKSKLSRLLLNSGNLDEIDEKLKLVKLLGLGGLHLTSGVLLNYPGLDKLIGNNRDLVWSGSCHDDKEISIVNTLRLDFIVISPILPSTSCPSDNYLGWEKFGSLVKLSSVPVYGLGGLNINHLKEVELAGGQGVAAIQSFWQLHKF
ncbi:Thiamin phosphate synthase, partial [Conidiobolus coronatus NRRL 28638]